MSNISRTLRRYAAAQRVSLEDAGEAVQGQPGELSDGELANVAAKAAAEVAAEAADKAKAAAEGGQSTDGEAAPADQSTESTDGGDAGESTETADAAAPAGDDAVASAEVTGEEPAADAAAEPAADETPADPADTPAEEIQTPAEEELAALGEEGGEATAETTEAGEAAAEAPAGDEAAAPAEGEVAATQTEEAGITEDELGAAADTGEVAAAAVDAAVAADAGAESAEAGEVVAAGQADTVVEGTGDELNAEIEAADSAVVETPAADTDADEAAPAAEAPVQEEQAAEQAPAVAPGPQTDTSEAVQEIVNLTEAVAEAATAEDVVKQARQISDNLKEVADTADVVNESGGVTMESLAMLQLALRPHTTTLSRNEIGLGLSLESFADQPQGTRLKVSVEEIRDVIAELDQSQPYLERQAIESLDRVVSALKDALPSAVDRLKAVISQASVASDTNEGAPVKIGDGLSAALCVNGAFPADLANELQSYSLLGNCLLGNYSEAAFRNAKQASLLVNAIDFSSASAFWERVAANFAGGTDPRCVLTASQLEVCLPGGAHLFAEAQPEPECPNPVLKDIMDFNQSHAPLEAMVAGKCDGDAEATAPALSASKIVLVGKSLVDTLCCERICEVLGEGQKLWPEAQDSIRHLRENLSNAPREIDQSIGADFSQLIKYVEVSYSLATWPLVNWLANAVLTVNAFVLFAERSLKAKAEELPPVEHHDEVVETAAPVVEEAAAAPADAAIDPAAEVSLESLAAQVATLREQLDAANATIAQLSAK